MKRKKRKRLVLKKVPKHKRASAVAGRRPLGTKRRLKKPTIRKKAVKRTMPDDPGTYVQGFDKGYDQGFRAGLSKGMQDGYEKVS